jgi:hypothetical protein
VTAKTAAAPPRPSSASKVPVTFLAILGIAVLLAVSLVLGDGLFFLVAAACVLGLSLYAIWRLIAALAGEDEDPAADESKALRRRRDLVNTKETALKIVQELEFDHQLGRISDADYQTLAGPVKQAALAAIKGVEDEQNTYRDVVESELAKRLRAEGLTPYRGEGAATEEAKPREPKKGKARAAAAPRERACPGCSRDIDRDSMFCKFCGHKISAESAGSE